MAESNTKKIVHVHLGGQNYKTVLSAGQHELIADEPERAGGKNLGPDPYDHLLMALGSCTAITVRMYAERKNWPLEDIFVELRYFKDHAEDCADCDESDAKIDKIEKDLIIKGELEESQLQKLLEIADKCPVNRTLKSTIEMKSAIVKR